MAPSRRSLALAASLAASAAAQETPGCFYHPFAAPTPTNPYEHGIYRYLDSSVTAPSSYVDSPVACQELCKKDDKCSVFTYFPNSRACWLQTSAATLNVTIGVYYGGETTAGPKVCDEVPPRCRTVVDAGFPGTLEQAFPTEYQPRKGVCFRKIDRSGPFPAYDSCRPSQVVQQISNCGWGPVVGVAMAVGDAETKKRNCRAMCEANPDCSAYEVKNSLCYTGIGENCTLAAAGQEASGERIVRGSTRVMYSWSGTRFVAGAAMREGFVPEQQFKKMLDIKQFPNIKDAEKACREICASYLHCEFWQLDTEAGCFIDTSGPNSGLAYPLISANFQPNAPTVVIGEYVQHLCGNTAATAAPTSAPAASAPTAGPFAPKVRFSYEIVNLNFSAIPADKLLLLRAAYAHDIAVRAGVADSSVLAMDNTQGVTLAPMPWTLNPANNHLRRLQATQTQVSTWLDARVAVPSTMSSDQLVGKVLADNRLNAALEDSTVRVLGTGASALVGKVSAAERMEIFPSTTPGKDHGLPWWVWLLIAGAVTIVVGSAVAFFSGCCEQKKRKSKSRRRNKEAAEEASNEVQRGVDLPLMGGNQASTDAAVAPVATAAQPVLMYVQVPQFVNQGVVLVAGSPMVQVASPAAYASGSPAAVVAAE